jgi:hypothetical protein
LSKPKYSPHQRPEHFTKPSIVRPHGTTHDPEWERCGSRDMSRPLRYLHRKDPATGLPRDRHEAMTIARARWGRVELYTATAAWYVYQDMKGGA